MYLRKSSVMAFGGLFKVIVMSDYLERSDEQDDGNITKNTKSRPEHSGQKKKTLETKGPEKDKNYKVLHNDGSLGKLPEKEGKGSGALDGTVGRGM
jgi:hypothetical protein